MNTLTWILIGAMALLFVLGVIIPMFRENGKAEAVANHSNNMCNIDNESLKVASYNMIVPLRVQACERLLLYLERIKFSVLVKRVFVPGMSRDDFQLSLIQNVQDEFEHNLAQRLYVAEDTWQLVNLAKEEVLQNVNAAFNEDTSSDVASVALIISAFQNPIAEKAILGLKMEFDSFLV